LELIELPLEICQVDVQPSPRAIVVCVPIGGIKVYQPCYPFGMPRSDGTQLLARDGMSHKHRTVKLEGVKHSQDVVTEPISRVSSSGNARGSIPASRNSVNVILRGKFGREVVIDVGCVSDTR
jgi:hypothetical protein